MRTPPAQPVVPPSRQTGAAPPRHPWPTARTQPAPERKDDGADISHLAVECELKLAGDGETGVVEGYASVFGVLDRGGDIMLPGAFKASLAAWRKKKQLPPMLWQHDPSMPVGVWTEFVEDEKGLKVKGELILEVPQAAIARALMLKGAVRSMSIGYRTLDADIDRQTGARHLKKVDLWEVSLVTFPMLPEAVITSAKGEFDAPGWERAFRAEGLSNREAKLATSVARKLTLRDGGHTGSNPRDEEAKDLLLSLRKAASALT